MDDRKHVFFTLSVLVLSILFLDFSVAFSRFKDIVPNGHNVPNPCKNGTTWDAVGHLKPKEGTPRNPFGLDFKFQNLTYTLALHERDSDGDGMTNGQELAVELRNGSFFVDETRKPIGHPGICEPVGSEKCKHQNFSCDGII